MSEIHMDLSRDPLQKKLGMILAFGALLWGGTYNALAKDLTPYLSPMLLLIVSELLTALFIVLTFGLVPLLRKLVVLDRRTILIAMLVGIFNSVLSPLLWFYGLSKTSAMNASMLSSVEMLSVLILGALVLGERLTRMQIIGASVVLFGVLIINVGGPAGGLGLHIGDLFIVAGATISGAGAVLFKKYLAHVMPELAILIRNVTGIVIVLSIGAMLRQPFVEEVQAFPMQKVLLLLAFTFFSRYLTLTFFYEALDRLQASTISLIDIAAPLSGLLFAYLILDEQLHVHQLSGVIFIILGLLLEQVSEQAIMKVRARSILSHIPHFKLHDRMQESGILKAMQ